ncbi:4'-phosphopantetheinyl transferase superfamily protein [Streptomyces sp. NBC_01351]|uniref:4'-phosphopantetheinyl transferase family protein n=1 Tax=Streptomyces sp. NBC_01351 TaxID=2903833 RepID=UPI002E35F431|nr:4'-phosphopantetheinyl transferase superfamily protein [Streptomyces sp. NBC_01351]
MTAPRFTVEPHRLDLWLVHSPQGAEAEGLDRSDLDDAERRRAAAFVRPADALLYAASHVALRRLLGRYTDTAPGLVRFVRERCVECGGEHGRPAVDSPSPPLHFSLSHSAGIAVVGIAAVPVGVDVERLPHPATVEFCTPSLHPRERAELGAASGTDRTGLFGRIWTRKEAYLKGLGTGLRRPPAQDYLGTDAAGHPAGWTVLDVPCAPTHVAAAAVRGGPPRTVHVRRLAGEWLRAPTAPALLDA